MSTLDLSYPALLQTLGSHYVNTGTESRAMLGWFLANYYRLDEEDIYFHICDSTNDKGVDGIYINKQLKRIDVFQATVIKTDARKQGDNKLKTFAGTLGQLSTRGSAEVTVQAGGPDLKALAERITLLKFIELGYPIRGVYVTNGDTDPAATTYLSTNQQIVYYDRQRLEDEHVNITKTDPISTEAVFDISDVETITYPMGLDITMVIAPIAARELVAMEGISNGDLFAYNVRQFLGKKTEVNKLLEKSIREEKEHRYFPAFHNGVTVLCRKLTIPEERDKITITGYAVVNGCQSITGLFENRNSITADLRIITKFIQVEPDSVLAANITHHTNNQNGTTQRDLKSNDDLHMRMQTRMHEKYPEFHYRIKRGEHPEWPKEVVIENELAARLLLAFDLDRPESWSQNYKLFDDLHNEIFGRPDVNEDRIVFLYDVYRIVLDKLVVMQDQLFAQYVLTKWLVMHLLREALLLSVEGRNLFENPTRFFEQPNGRRRIAECMEATSLTLIRLLEGTITGLRKKTAPRTPPVKNAPPPFDHKTALKSRDSITDIIQTILPQYQTMIDGGMTKSFDDKWPSTETTAPE